MSTHEQHVNLNVEGMSCGGCVRRLDQGLRKIPGVTVEEVKVGSARLRLDPDKTTMVKVNTAISELGFTSSIAGG
jgi:copper chaperone CopZ